MTTEAELIAADVRSAVERLNEHLEEARTFGLSVRLASGRADWPDTIPHEYIGVHRIISVESITREEIL